MQQQVYIEQWGVILCNSGSVLNNEVLYSAIVDLHWAIRVLHCTTIFLHLANVVLCNYWCIM